MKPRDFLPQLLAFAIAACASDEHMLSTGGCIIDPRPKPTNPVGISASAVSDPLILVQYYQDKRNPKIVKILVSYSPTVSEPLEFVPFGGGKDKFLLQQAPPESPWTILMEHRGDGRLYLSWNGTDILNRFQGSLDDQALLDVSSVRASKVQPFSDSIDIHLNAFGVTTGFSLRRPSQPIFLTPPWSNSLSPAKGTDGRVLLLRAAATPGWTPQEMYIPCDFAYWPFNGQSSPHSPEGRIRINIPSAEVDPYYVSLLDGSKEVGLSKDFDNEVVVEKTSNGFARMKVVTGSGEQTLLTVPASGSRAALWGLTTRWIDKSLMEFRFHSFGAQLGFRLRSQDLRPRPAWTLPAGMAVLPK